MKRLILLFIFSLISCDIADKDGSIRKLLANQIPKIPEFKANIAKYDFEEVPLLNPIYKMGYSSFLSSAFFTIYNKVQEEQIPLLSQQITSKVGLGTTHSKLLESSMVATGFANVILTLVSIPDTKKAKMFVVIGQKKDWMDKTSDFSST